MSRGSTRSGLGKHFCGVTVGGSAELAEGGKEMVMAGFSSGNKLSHGKGVQQVAIERTVLQGDASWRLACSGIAWRRRERKGCAINAQAILRGVLDEAFRIDCAGEMVMKVAALRHLLQERVQKQRLIAHRLKISSGLLFCERGRRSFFLRPTGGSANRKENGEQTNAESFQRARD
jgi:hypothetical protein